MNLNPMATRTSGAVATLARILIGIALPASVVWIPLATIPATGTVALIDAVLATLWLLTLLNVAMKPQLNADEARAWSIAVLAIAPGIFAALGSWTFDPTASPLIEFGI